MLNFDEQRFINIQSGAMSLAPRLRATICEELAKGALNLVFLGVGGAGILMLPALQLLRRHSKFAVTSEISAEMVLGNHGYLGPKTIVIIPSLSGTTMESVEALKYCRKCGATVVVLTGYAHTVLADGADHVFVNFAEDDTSCESFYMQSLVIALSILDYRGEIDDFEATIAELELLPSLLVVVKKNFECCAEQIAEKWKAEPFHIIAGAGSTWPGALYYGMCILEEMQWIRTRPVHASDFFHGTLELVEPNLSIIILKGEDSTRFLLERVQKFAVSITNKIVTVDCAEFELPGISPRVRNIISPVILASVLERVSAHLEIKRDHPLDRRRYYKRLDY